MWDKVESAVGEVFREARAPDLRALSVESLEKLALTARESHEEVSQQILEKGQEQHRAAEDGDWRRFGACREEIRLLQEEWLDLRDQIKHLEETLRRKRLDVRVIERLGSRERAIALEATVVVLIIAVLGMLVWEELFRDTATPGFIRTLAIIDTCICVFFLGEFFWKMSLADSPRWYFKRYWVDFVSSLPFALLHAELLRVGRVARLARVARAARIARMARFMRLLRALRGLAFVFRGFEKIGQSLNIRVLNRPLVATAIFLVIGGILMGVMEGDAFREYGSAVRGGIWWSFTTVCTGGFADIHDPDTDWGRALTVLLVILGAILTGAFTAALASVLLGDDTERIERKLATVLERLNSSNQVRGRSDTSGDTDTS